MDKVLAITGASTGIGAATARLAAEAGWRLVLAARSLDRLNALADELGGAERAIAVAVDVSRPEDLDAMVSAAQSAFGGIDAVFANAGIGATVPGVDAGEVDNWHAMAMTNLYGLALTARATLPHIRARRGHFVITGSVAGRKPLKGSFYGATKWAANAYGYNLREALAGSGARVTVIEPGMVDTPFFDEPKPQGLTADDVARTVLFALSQPEHVEIHELLVLPCRPA